MRTAYRVRQVVNAANLSTLAGLLVAKGYSGTLEKGPDGLVLARGVGGSFPRADAFTIGNVVLLRTPHASPTLLAHEGRHATQWACCVLLFLPLYLLCGGVSVRNPFERAADRYALTGEGWWPWDGRAGQ